MKGEQNGEGEMKYANGEIYTGNWNLNARHGKGKWIKKDGEIIEVSFFVNN